MFIARMVCWSLLGLVLAGLGATWDTWQFWTVLGLVWALEQIQYIDFVNALEQTIEDLRAQHKGQHND